MKVGTPLLGYAWGVLAYDINRKPATITRDDPHSTDTRFAPMMGMRWARGVLQRGGTRIDTLMRSDCSHQCSVAA